jgi:chemotaxis protein MotB
MGSGNDRLRAAIHTPEEAHVNEDDESIWLISYADLMTLLFTFFVMLYASLLTEQDQELRQSLKRYLQGDGSSPHHAATPSTSDLQKTLHEELEKEELLRDVKIQLNARGLQIVLSSSLLFDLGSAELRPDSRAALAKVVALIKDKGPRYKVRVEGHTDDNPVTRGRYRSNWELSGARASHIVELFERMGFPAQRLVAVGYSDSRPLMPNRSKEGLADPEAQRLNRRVVISLYQEKSETPTEPQ